MDFLGILFWDLYFLISYLRFYILFCDIFCDFKVYWQLYIDSILIFVHVYVNSFFTKPIFFNRFYRNISKQKFFLGVNSWIFFRALGSARSRAIFDVVTTLILLAQKLGAVRKAADEAGRCPRSPFSAVIRKWLF